MAKVENSVVPAVSLAGSTLPKLGALAAIGSTLMVPACASMRSSKSSERSVTSVVAPLEAAERIAIQQGRAEFAQAQGAARSLGIVNFVYVASNGREYTNFSKAESIEGDTAYFQKSVVRLTERGESLEFTLEAFETWKARQVATALRHNLSGSIIDFDGQVWSMSNVAQPVARVEPFLVLRNQR